jgi:uncharacterized membrane protein YccC
VKVTSDQILFSVKLFIAAMLAFAVAVRIGLPQPYWALVTCCVLMNPATGAIRSKAVYRVAGTLGAGIVTLGMVAIFASVPLLLIISSGIVATIAFGVSFLDRTPRAYGFQLFAVTLMLVAVAGVDHPETMFDTVVARVTEISLGVLATTFVDSVIAPRSLGGLMRSNLRRWLPDMERWANDVLDGRETGAQEEHDRLKILSDVTALSQMVAWLRYDPTVDRGELRHVLAIQQRLLSMVPLLSAIAARIAGLTQADRAALAPYLAEARDTFRTGAMPSARPADDVRSLPLEVGRERPWQQLVHDDLADMLMDLLTLWSEICRIDRALEGRAVLDRELAGQVRRTAAFPLASDVDHAARSAAGIFVAYILLCGLWLATGWHQGPNAVLMGTVAVAFFGGGDEPGKAIAAFGRFAVLSLFLAAILAYGLLPLANDFPTFLIVMGLFMLPIGMWAAANPMGVLVLAFGLSNINLQGHYMPYDFAFFLEVGFASLIGMYVAFLGASLFRQWGVSHQVHRFLCREALEIARLSHSATRRARDLYIQRALDRIAGMTMRLAASGQVERSAALLARLRVGVNIADLRIIGTMLDPAARDATVRVLEQFRREFDAAQPSPRLLALVDEALNQLWPRRDSQKSSPVTRAIRSLAGLRIALFERAPAWIPAS